MLLSLLKRIIPQSLHPYPLFCLRLEKALRGRVLSGPFRNMLFSPTFVGSYLWPRALGTYELELHAIIYKLLATPFARLVNVGAGDGFYAIGVLLGSQIPEAIVFETSTEGQKAIAESATRNRVSDRLKICGTCNTDLLSSSLVPNTLLIMDVEGAEKSLLDPKQVPPLTYATILVETHEFAVAGISEILRQRFSESHSIEEIISKTRQLADFPTVPGIPHSGIPKKYLLWAMEEGRPANMSWLILTPQR